MVGSTTQPHSAEGRVAGAEDWTLGQSQSRIPWEPQQSYYLVLMTISLELVWGLFIRGEKMNRMKWTVLVSICLFWGGRLGISYRVNMFFLFSSRKGAIRGSFATVNRESN